MYDRAFTPERIDALKAGEIFVFGSNLAGMHAGGAARIAHKLFGAVWGQGVGLWGQSYAIPTMQGGVETIKPYADEFIAFASRHRAYTFYVTKIGCGIAGFTCEEIAPLFERAIALPNVILPKEFVQIIERRAQGAATAGVSWDSERDFLATYRDLTERIKRGDHDAYNQLRALRSEEFRNTVALARQGFYLTETGRRVSLGNGKEMARGTVFYDRAFRTASPAVADSAIEVVNEDCLSVGVRLKREGYNPAVLNMASHRNPGGGVATGSGAQEETLFRRTDLFRSLFPFAPYAGEYGLRMSGHQYPLDRNYGGIYTPGATLFREAEPLGYKLMETPETLAFIAVAGVNCPDITPEGQIADHHVAVIKNKIRTILRIGLRHGHDALVLGALGCGAFRNPPRHVARIFHEVFEEGEFEQRFRLLAFAILDDHNAHRRHNPEGNYLPFAEEFRGMGRDA